MEVILFTCCLILYIKCILHVCGGDPKTYNFSLKSPQYSPRMWRWSSPMCSSSASCFVFSTYVEVILIITIKNFLSFCILHVCGGDPWKMATTSLERLYSPRMWRWSLKKRDREGKKFVFSTYVEVILIAGIYKTASHSILHVCGGDPNKLVDVEQRIMYSPRMWRWSQF